MWPFSDFQYGFRSSRSTADLLTVLSDRIVGAFNRPGATRAVALDISKTFDRVWHAGLLHKLKSYGNTNKDTNKDSEEFLDKLYTNFLLPYITSPSCVTPRSQTLIDNFFSNIIEEGLNSGNLTTTISDHFVQFVLFKTEKTNKCNSKDTKYIRDFIKNLNKENFESDIKETKWDEILELNKGNVDF